MSQTTAHMHGHHEATMGLAGPSLGRELREGPPEAIGEKLGATLRRATTARAATSSAVPPIPTLLNFRKKKAVE